MINKKNLRTYYTTQRYFCNSSHCEGNFSIRRPTKIRTHPFKKFCGAGHFDLCRDSWSQAGQGQKMALSCRHATARFAKVTRRTKDEWNGQPDAQIWLYRNDIMPLKRAILWGTKTSPMRVTHLARRPTSVIYSRTRIYRNRFYRIIGLSDKILGLHISKL